MIKYRAVFVPIRTVSISKRLNYWKLESWGNGIENIRFRETIIRSLTVWMDRYQRQLMKLAGNEANRFPNTCCHDPTRILIRGGSWKFAIRWRSTVNLRGRIQGKNSKKRRRKGRSNTGLTVKGIIHPRHGYYFDVGRYFKRSTRERIDFHRDNFLPRRYKKLAVGGGNVP